MRVEYDLLGKLAIPKEVYYGAQTERARLLCNPSKEKLYQYPEIITSIAAIKKAAAIAHRELKVLDSQIADAIVSACDEILDGGYLNQFIVDIFNGGGGVSIHMNLNEVIANRANEIITGEKGYDLVHPNTHVNMGQSTNDVLPSAMKIALYHNLKAVIRGVKPLRDITKIKSEEFVDIVKVSRTCIQDAVPITLGQTFSSYYSFFNRQVNELEKLLNDILFLPLGATAVGTGLGAYKGYKELAINELGKITGLDIKSEENLFDGLQNTDLYVKTSAALKALATGTSKIATDIRLMSSGPRSGFNEIEIASTQNGSSIMPGKVNPALPELMNMVCYQVCGNDVSITMASEGGELDLNVWESVIIINLLGSCKLLSKTMPVFAEKCVKTIKPNYEKCKHDAENSLALAVVVSAMFGYEKGSEVAKLASKQNSTIKEAAIKMGLLTSELADKVLDPLMLSDSEKSGELFIKIKRKEDVGSV